MKYLETSKYPIGGQIRKERKKSYNCKLHFPVFAWWQLCSAVCHILWNQWIFSIFTELNLNINPGSAGHANNTVFFNFGGDLDILSNNIVFPYMKKGYFPNYPIIFNVLEKWYDADMSLGKHRWYSLAVGW
jgi:hypothetical protein